MKTKLTLTPIPKAFGTIGILFLGFLCAEAQEWAWSGEDYLSYPRTGVSATVMDDSIFYSGGKIDEYHNYSSIIDIYDIGEDVWDTYVPQTPGRWQTNAVSANGMVFIAGGNDFNPNGSWSAFPHIDVYSKESGEWTIEYLSEARNNTAGIACGNKLFFAGGLGAVEKDFVYFNLINIYDTESKSWSTDSLSVPRCLIGTVAVGSKVFFAGGLTALNEVTNLIDIYDINTGEWDIEFLSVSRASTAAVAYNGKVYFAGGALPNNTSSVIVDIYNIETETWDDSITLSSPRIVTALNIKNALVFTGYSDYINLSTFTWYGENGIVDIYYPETGNWDYSVSELNPPRHFYAYAAYDNKAYYAGGWPNSPSPTNVINILKYTYCLPDGIIFTTQAEIDNFQTNHPYCSEIGGDVEINGNEITNLDGLNFVTGIGGDLSIINCDNLTSLWGLENIKSESIVDLSIYNNESLSECDIWNICYYINNTNGIIDIHDNATGCDTEEDVIEACLTSVDNISYVDELIISPNPCSGSVNLRYTIYETGYVILKLFEVSGIKVKSLINEIKIPGTYEMKIDLSDLTPGIYFCVLKTSEGIQTKKIIKLN